MTRRLQILMLLGGIGSALLLPARSVYAQEPHPCDAAIQVEPSISGPASVSFCWDGKDELGQTIPASLFKVYVGANVTPSWTGALVPIGTATAAGLKYYSTPPITFPAGKVSLLVTVTSADGKEGASSPPFSFAVLAALPSAPTKVRVGGQMEPMR